MAAKSNLKNMALSLTVVCLVCSALLGGVYAVTAEPIRKAEEAKVGASIARVLPGFSEQPSLETVNVGGTDYTYYSTTVFTMRPSSEMPTMRERGPPNPPTVLMMANPSPGTL